jgi:hypothetical protein
MKELAKALLAARKEMGKLINNAKNPHYRSNYATLDEVIRVAQEPLAEAGICVLESTAVISENNMTVQKLELREVESGDSHQSTLPLICKDPSNPQQLKSAQTYARRMLWTAAAGLAPEDDDGNAASQSASIAQPTQDPLALLKPHETAIIAFAASKGTIIAGVHELPSSWLRDPQKLITTASEYAANNTVTKEVVKS